MDWQGHIAAGRNYLKTAVNGLARPSVFTNALVYHLTAMAIEHLLAGVYFFHRKMPLDHTLDGLVDGLASFCPLDTHLAESIKCLGQYDDMCPLVPVRRVVPDDMAIRAILAVGKQVAGFVELHVTLSIPNTVSLTNHKMGTASNRA